VCGKNSVVGLFWFAKLGSPPRVREELFSSLYFLSSSRITPACAGRTDMGKVIGMEGKDHPRVCGKN